MNKGDENGKWRRLHKDKFHSSYRTSNIVRLIMSRKLIWTDHLASMEERESALKIKVHLQERDL